MSLSGAVLRIIRQQQSCPTLDTTSDTGHISIRRPQCRWETKLPWHGMWAAGQHGDAFHSKHSTASSIQPQPQDARRCCPRDSKQDGKIPGVMREQGWMTCRGLDGKQMEGRKGSDTRQESLLLPQSIGDSQPRDWRSPASG